MSGTSLDGIDVAIVDISGKRPAPRAPSRKVARSPGAAPLDDGRYRLRLKPVAFRSTPYAKPVREAILAVANQMAHTATIARLHFLLGELYADALRETCRRGRVRLDSIALVGMHGQTIFHEGDAIEYLGRPVASTLQIGEAAVVAERTGLPVVSNFRERDIAAGGKGAPLVPFTDYLLFRHARYGRVALNIGGIANISVIPAAGLPADVIAFDTGPGNMVIDALVTHMSGGRQRYDRDGRLARRGTIHSRLLDAMLCDPYLALDPPKTAGREQFGQQFANGLIATGLPIEDLIATATEFTARSIAGAIQKAALREHAIREVIVSGGGVHNRRIMRRLAELLPDLAIVTSAEYGIDPNAKEAIAFAVLAYAFAEGHSANLPSATGARRAVLLGKSTPKVMN